MIKFITIQILLVNFLYSQDIDIQKLQNEFYENVITLNVFKKRFPHFLNKQCQKDYICLQKQVKKLQTWESVQKDKKLQTQLQRKHSLSIYDEKYWKKILSKLKQKDIPLSKSQFVSIIDLENQYFIVSLWNKESNKYEYIGRDLISSGNIKRESEVKYGENHYLKTPTGVFETKLGWRSDGKINNDNFTLGYGQKDSYVFYFGKQETIRYNTFDKNGNKILNPHKWRMIKDTLDLALHAHKSRLPMGTPNSHGCIRTTDELNKFLDNNLVLHNDVLQGTQWNHKYAKAPAIPKYFDFAGKYLIIFDKI